ncbi:serine/threonine-protein phosphatase 6 regulatory ankyrin repeat subunit A-like [Ylistrum balloti]|uniref:serine/threonine-protein phosphatase 6 regulatory ankyrin repeat subunit A-like n=1 Tax=Ylistrum balloti TaxID=509963 RepID=UPI002905AF13|nr:serine/threonine-protein phosphatase 6 regulatory ankyrin repeat subunit A-like [Ylistrum balloti]
MVAYQQSASECQRLANAMAMNVLAMLKKDESRLIRKAKQLVKKRRNFARKVFIENVDGWTPAHACALRGSKKLLKVMVNSGFDINTQMGQPEGLPNGCTLLHIAAYRGDADICKYLISCGADVDAKDSFGRTPLYYTTRHNNRYLFNCFEKTGADISALDKWLPNWRSDHTNECMTPQQKSITFCFF